MSYRKPLRNPHLGSSFDDFLKEMGIFEEVDAAARKRVKAMEAAEEKIIKAWVTKYLFTIGIVEMHGFIAAECPTMLVVKGEPGTMGAYYHGKDWHRSLAEAKVQAKKMIASKKKSIQKSLKKLAELEKSL